MQRPFMASPAPMKVPHTPDMKLHLIARNLENYFLISTSQGFLYNILSLSLQFCAKRNQESVAELSGICRRGLLKCCIDETSTEFEVILFLERGKFSATSVTPLCLACNTGEVAKDDDSSTTCLEGSS